MGGEEWGEFSVINYVKYVIVSSYKGLRFGLTTAYTQVLQLTGFSPENDIYSQHNCTCAHTCTLRHFQWLYLEQV